jgi:hypothetical protein
VTPALDALARGTPAARGLPLLGVLARRAAAEITLGYLDDMALVLDNCPVGPGSEPP